MGEFTACIRSKVQGDAEVLTKERNRVRASTGDAGDFDVLLISLKLRRPLYFHVGCLNNTQVTYQNQSSTAYLNLGLEQTGSVNKGQRQGSALQSRSLRVVTQPFKRD